MAPRADLDEARSRAWYEFQYDLAIFVFTSAIPAGAALLALSIAFLAARFSAGTCPMALVGIWPPNRFVLQGLGPPLTNGWTQQLGSPLCVVELCSSAVAGVWIVWLIFRIGVDAYRPVAFVGPSWPFVWTALGAVVLIWTASLPMSDHFDLHTISIGDPLGWILLKRASFISVAFWMLGYSQFHLVSFLRNSWRQRRTVA
jgi:hypothetical protein